MSETLLHSSVVGPTVEEPVFYALDVKEGSKMQIRGGRRGFGRCYRADLLGETRSHIVTRVDE